MTVTKSLLACVLFVAAASFPVSASSSVSVAASAGSNNCSQFDPTSASCNVSFPISSQTATASGFADATWALSGSGTLEASANGFGPNTKALAVVSFSNLLIVTGGTGSGNLQVVFSGFQMNVLNIPGGASAGPVGVAVGGFSTNATLPNGSPQTFSVIAPITFNLPTVFNVGFSATASGTFFNNGTFAANNADGILQFPTFVVTDANGNVLRNASVQFVPEPSTWFFVALGFVALLVIHRMKACRTTAENSFKQLF